MNEGDSAPARVRRHLRARWPYLWFGALCGAVLVAVGQCGEPAHDVHVVHGESQRAAGGAPGQGATQWTCSMHPEVRRDGPGACPICGMDLVPVAPSAAAPEHAHAAPGTGVSLSPRARALSRISTTPVSTREGSAGSVRLLGRVEADETRLRTVTAWTAGRIDRLHVRVTGERLRKGQVIATLYSPEVFAAHQDLLVALDQVQQLQASPAPSRQAAAAALAAAQQRLRLLGVSSRDLSRLQQQAEPTRAVDIRSPFAGTVIERMATEGAYVDTGAPLYRIADLGTLWVQLDAYESDLPRLALGQAVRITVDALPGERFDGQVTFIDPTLDERRRTARVRVEVDNRAGRLRPGMFAEAMVTVDAERDGPPPLMVPQSAPLFTGKRVLVYVEHQVDGQFVYEPRPVRLGPRLGDAYPVVSGLAAAERVVTRGAFVVDADLQIRGGESLMAKVAAPSPPAAPVSVTAEQLARLRPAVQAYLAVQQALAADDLEAARAAAAELQRATHAVVFEAPTVAEAWAPLSERLDTAARGLVVATDLAAARLAFEAGSHALSTLLQRFGNPLPDALHWAYCPMAMGSTGAAWVQQGATIDNAYFGQSMRTCGEVRQVVAPGARLSSGHGGAPGSGRSPGTTP